MHRGAIDALFFTRVPRRSCNRLRPRRDAEAARYRSGVCKRLVTSNLEEREAQGNVSTILFSLYDASKIEMRNVKAGIHLEAELRLCCVSYVL